MLTFLALAHMLEKKDAADSLVKFKRALNADATLFVSVLSPIISLANQLKKIKSI